MAFVGRIQLARLSEGVGVVVFPSMMPFEVYNL